LLGSSNITSYERHDSVVMTLITSLSQPRAVADQLRCDTLALYLSRSPVTEQSRNTCVILIIEYLMNDEIAYFTVR